MKEIINLHIGQAGLQIADSCWQLMLNQHHLDLDGKQIEGKQQYDNSVMMVEARSGKYSPRAVFIDTEPTVLDQMKKHEKKGFYNQNFMHNAKCETGNLFSDGYRGLVSQKYQFIIKKIRKLAENCNSLEGFILTNALQGGTGSGLTSRIIQHQFMAEYSKIMKISMPIYGAPNICNIPIAAYNEVLSFTSLLNNMNLTILLDNEALYKICTQSIGIQSPTFKDINAIIARMYSTFTIPLRFNTLYNHSLGQVVTNLVPYPRLQSVIPAMFPFYNPDEPLSSTYSSQPNIVQKVFSSQNVLLCCNRSHGYHLSNYLMFQGDVTPYQAQKMAHQFDVKGINKNVDFIPTNYKIKTNSKCVGQLNNTGLGRTKRSILCLSNANFIAQSFAKIDHKFDTMYSKRAFVHWYVQNMQEGLFSQCRQDMAALQKDYEYGWADSQIAYGIQEQSQY